MTLPDEPDADRAEVYKSAADCPLGAAHGMASTHHNAADERVCDWCGFPATDLDMGLDGWQPIETFEKHGQANPVIVAVTDADRAGIVGEAWRHEDGEWWWAGTAPGDYYDNPISQIQFGQVTHWQPLPPPPEISRA